MLGTRLDTRSRPKQPFVLLVNIPTSDVFGAAGSSVCLRCETIDIIRAVRKTVQQDRGLSPRVLPPFL